MSKDSENICDELKSTVVCHVPNSLTREEGFVEPLFEQPHQRLPLVLPEFPSM